MPTEEEYKKACKRLEEIINLVNNDTPKNDSTYQELMKVSDIIDVYEEEHFPIGEPTLEHKGYKGGVNGDEGSYWGKVQSAEPDGVFYQGSSLEELEEDFRSVLDFYLDSKQ